MAAFHQPRADVRTHPANAGNPNMHFVFPSSRLLTAQSFGGSSLLRER
jgi:hypothetical protein